MTGGTTLLEPRMDIRTRCVWEAVAAVILEEKIPKLEDTKRM